MEFEAFFIICWEDFSVGQRTHGVCVIFVLTLSLYLFACLPLWLSTAHYLTLFSHLFPIFPSLNFSDFAIHLSTWRMRNICISCTVCLSPPLSLAIFGTLSAFLRSLSFSVFPPLYLLSLFVLGVYVIFCLFELVEWVLNCFPLLSLAFTASLSHSVSLSLSLSMSALHSFPAILLFHSSSLHLPVSLAFFTTHPLSLALSFSWIYGSRLNLTQTCLVVAVFFLVVVVSVVVAVWGVQTDALIVSHLFSPAQAAACLFFCFFFVFVFVFLQLFHSLLFNSKLTLLLWLLLLLLWLLVCRPRAANKNSIDPKQILTAILARSAGLEETENTKYDRGNEIAKARGEVQEDRMSQVKKIESKWEKKRKWVTVGKKEKLC